MLDNLQNIIITFGYVGIFTVIFAESGFLLGFFLPGDSLLFTVGILASRGFFNIWILVIFGVIFAVLGDNFGYYFGKKIGPKIFRKEDSFLFHRDHIRRTEAFYLKYGKKTIILARFVPIIRTFAPILAGVGKMDYKTFFTYNIIGGVAWTAGMLLLGFSLGQVFPEIEKHLSWVIILIIVLSLIPLLREFLKARKEKKL